MTASQEMYEAKWHRYFFPAPMISYLKNIGASPRKLRLFACACFRSIWPDQLNSADPGVAAVLVAERFAEGTVKSAELGSVYLAATNCTGQAAAEEDAAWAADQSATTATLAAGRRGHMPRTSVDNWLYHAPAAAGRENRAKSTQARMLRDIFNPFRPVAIDPLWLSACNGAVLKLAQEIYDGRDFQRLPALADTLEASGCTNEEVLKHLRNGEEHYRGCWVIDLLLAKE